VLAAVLTPPDILSQVILAIPLCILYAISIGISWIIDRSRAKKQS
jgi:sec-independent protein translocase protein TatC